MQSSRRRNRPHSKAKQPSATKKIKKFRQHYNIRSIVESAVGKPPGRNNPDALVKDSDLYNNIVKCVKAFTTIANQNQHRFTSDRINKVVTRLLSTHCGAAGSYQETVDYSHNGPFTTHKEILDHLLKGDEYDVKKVNDNVLMLLDIFETQPEALKYYFMSLNDADKALHAEILHSFHLSLTLIDRHNKYKEDRYPIEYFTDYMSIAYILNKKDYIPPMLDLLESKLQDYAHKHFGNAFPINENGVYSLPFDVTNIHDRHKVLSTVLYSWAKENGFQSSSKLLRAISAKQFRSLLSSLSFMKDVGITDVGKLHGAWSHAIQWFCLIEYNKQHAFLTHDPLELYRYSEIVWNQIFDIIHHKGFTCPDGITRILIEPESYERWPLLSETIARSQSKMISPHFNYEEMTRKKHGEVYEKEGFVIRPFK